MSVLVSITKCMFCDGYVPASYDDVYIKHMNDHHRAFVNIKFLFQVSLLSDDELDSFIAGTPKITREITEEDVKVEIADNFVDIEEPINPTVSLEVVPVTNEELEIDDSKDEDEPINQSDSLEDGELEIDDLKDDFSKTISKEKMKKLKVNIKKIKKEEKIKSSNDPRNLSLVCHICGYAANNQYALKDHKNIYHDETLKICETCGKTVKGLRRYQKHLTGHRRAEVDKVQCPECKKVVTRLSRHLNIVHSVKSFVCEFCAHVAKNQYALTYHKKFHDTTLKNCETCGKTVVGFRRYQKHLESHKDKVECPKCKKVVRRLSRHLIIMHAVRLFSCDTCEKKFHSERFLQKHLVVHSDERPFICRYGCDYTCKKSSNRTAHEIKKHNAKSEHDTKAKLKSGELTIGSEMQV